MVGDGAFSHKIHLFFKDILNLKGHTNHITGSEVTAILLNGWILPIGSSFSGGGCAINGATPLV